MKWNVFSGGGTLLAVFGTLAFRLQPFGSKGLGQKGTVGTLFSNDRHIGE